MYSTVGSLVTATVNAESAVNQEEHSNVWPTHTWLAANGNIQIYILVEVFSVFLFLCVCVFSAFMFFTIAAAWRNKVYIKDNEYSYHFQFQ